MKPFIKWPGGKSWLVSKYRKYLPQKFDRYFEPFLGGGALFWHLCPPKAIISDVNADLINAYQIMRDDPIRLAELMKHHEQKHSNEYYYSVRQYAPCNQIEQAARFLYLNRTCYNGMYRVNQHGRFNVPIGTKNRCAYDIAIFSEMSAALRSATLITGDFENILSHAQNGDFVFADPPYTIAHNSNSFIKYNEKLFSWEDQKRLAKELASAKKRGVIILATNANHVSIRELYEEEEFHLTVVERYCSISGDARKRGNQEELIITSYPV